MEQRAEQEHGFVCATCRAERAEAENRKLRAVLVEALDALIADPEASVPVPLLRLVGK